MDTTAAPEIRYFRPEYAPNIELFECARLHASMTTQACARRWLTREYPCVNCEIGEWHAAQLGLHRRIQASMPTPAPCLRCGRGTLKRVAGTLCTSCWNRTREWIIGRNRKGHPPTIKLHYFEALLVSAEERMRTRPGMGGAAVCELALGEYSVKMIALNPNEVERTIAALWPDAEIVEIGLAAAPSGPT